MRVLAQIGLVALGSACGGLTRWGVTVAAARWLGTAWPFGTLLINVSGSLFLGWFMTILSRNLLLSDHAWLRPDDLKLTIAVGFTGAYTTFSTFEWESHALARDGQGWSAALYVIASVALGLLAVHGGVMLAGGTQH